ncbi:MAG TPA: holo-ACP synthase [Pseudonocardiaceae bacterium]
MLVGLDLVGIARFDAALRRTPGLLDRLFTPAERLTVTGAPRSPASLAARFAAKEAAAKALHAPPRWRWHDCEVVTAASGAPTLVVRGELARVASGLGVRDWRVSLTHDADLAAAVVLALL